ncbi:hypothetical protein WG915_08880 [Corynebacterium sp. H128]|uniref:hypothetical protein n=1 Tax=Corynebacterium sp. H128 TaxID=3133427 RepID=UPI0030B3DDF0
MIVEATGQRGTIAVIIEDDLKEKQNLFIRATRAYSLNELQARSFADTLNRAIFEKWGEA